ncbi:MAG TPA: DUF2938 family protein [Gemmatimonadaceae bacterium]|nr:DUF2938 family protein [Gemmatimonadaceae bacterium]
MPILSWRSVGIGVASTLSMDILSGVALKVRLISPLPPYLVGRWFGSAARGHPVHADIATAPPANHEMVIALLGHYVIGITLTSLYLWGMSALGSPPNASSAIAFGLCTNALPWLIMFPAMGYGFFGQHGPPGTRLLVSSAITHACFGVGLWIASALLWRA